MFTSLDDAKLYIYETFDKLGVGKMKEKCEIVLNTTSNKGVACAEKHCIPGNTKYRIIFYQRAINNLKYPERDFREICVHEAVHIVTAFLHNKMGHDETFMRYMRICGFKNPIIAAEMIGGPECFSYRCECGATTAIPKRLFTPTAAGKKRYCKACGKYLTITNKEELEVLISAPTFFASLIKEFDLSLIEG